VLLVARKIFLAALIRVHASLIVLIWRITTTHRNLWNLVFWAELKHKFISFYNRSNVHCSFPQFMEARRYHTLPRQNKSVLGSINCGITLAIGKKRIVRYYHHRKRYLNLRFLLKGYSFSMCRKGKNVIVLENFGGYLP
jgi:hypothetical protein